MPPQTPPLLQEVLNISAAVSRMEGRQDEGMLLLESLTREVRDGIKEADDRLDAINERVAVLETHHKTICPFRDKTIAEIATRFEKHIEEHGKNAIEKAGRDGQAVGERRIKAKVVAMIVAGATMAGGTIATYWREIFAFLMGVSNAK